MSGSFDKILEGDVYDTYLKKHGMALWMEFPSNEGVNALGDKLRAVLCAEWVRSKAT